MKINRISKEESLEISAASKTQEEIIVYLLPRSEVENDKQELIFGLGDVNNGATLEDVNEFTMALLPIYASPALKCIPKATGIQVNDLVSGAFPNARKLNDPVLKGDWEHIKNYINTHLHLIDDNILFFSLGHDMSDTDMQYVALEATMWNTFSILGMILRSRLTFYVL